MRCRSQLSKLAVVQTLHAPRISEARRWQGSCFVSGQWVAWWGSETSLSEQAALPRSHWAGVDGTRVWMSGMSWSGSLVHVNKIHMACTHLKGALRKGRDTEVS
jgi:hypothetical protein